MLYTSTGFNKRFCLAKHVKTNSMGEHGGKKALSSAYHILTTKYKQDCNKKCVTKRIEKRE